MTATLGLVGASPSAAGPNCASGYHCVFYTDISSARQSFFNSDPDFSNDTFDEYNVSGPSVGGWGLLPSLLGRRAGGRGRPRVGVVLRARRRHSPSSRRTYGSSSSGPGSDRPVNR